MSFLAQKCLRRGGQQTRQTSSLHTWREPWLQHYCSDGLSRRSPATLRPFWIRAPVPPLPRRWASDVSRITPSRPFLLTLDRKAR